MMIGVQSSPLVRSAFCPMKIDHSSGLTLYPVTNHYKSSMIGDSQKLSIQAGWPYKQARLYMVQQTRTHFDWVNYFHCIAYLLSRLGNGDLRFSG